MWPWQLRTLGCRAGPQRQGLGDPASRAAPPRTRFTRDLSCMQGAGMFSLVFKSQGCSQPLALQCRHRDLPQGGPQGAQALARSLALTASLGPCDSVRIPLAAEKGISWREEGRDCEQTGPASPPGGQGRAGACPGSSAAQLSLLGHLQLPSIPPEAARAKCPHS